MGEVYQFPYDSSQFKRQIKQADQNGDLQAAYYYAKLCYQETDALEDLNTLVYYANEIGAYTEALIFMDDHIEAVLSHVTLSKLYCRLLMASGQAEVALELATVFQESHSSDPEWITLIDDIQSVFLLGSDDQVDKDHLKQQLKALNLLEESHQLNTVSQAHVLSNDTLLSIAPAILTARDLSQLIKTSFIQVLLQKGCKQALDLYWHEQERTVILATLHLFEEDPLLQGIMDQLDHRLMDYPNQRPAIVQEAVFHLMQLYPFAGEIIQDTDHWVQLYLQKFVQHSALSAENAQQLQQKAWFNKLIAII